MDVEEVLEFADHLVFAMTGKHLDSLQKAILRGSWDNQKYREIALRHYRSEKYVKEVGFRLWRLLSDVLGEELNKTNFRAALERRWRFSFVLQFGKAFVGTDNIPAETSHSSELPHPEQLDEDMSVGFECASVLSLSPALTTIPRQDLHETPDLAPFYGRTDELTLLEKWIASERCRIVALLGICGIGKTALAVKLVEQIKDKFDYAIWLCLRDSPPPAAIETNLIQFLSNQRETVLPLSADGKCSLLMEYLRSHRCLVILDDVQMVFSSGQLAGHYQPGYEHYGELFARIGELYHKSCLLLTSSDKPREIAALEGENRPVRSLHLDGLGTAMAREILKYQGLAEDDKWEKLIDYYQGNPLWLKIAATTIKDLFSGSVAEFFQYAPLFLAGDLKDRLNQQFNRLSEVEKQVMSAIASESESVCISKLLEQLQLLPADLLDALQSLGRRSLVAKKKQGEATLFTLQAVVRQFLRTKYPKTSK